MTSEGLPLRYLVFGAGAIGTYIGGSLALTGQKLVFLERPDVAIELRQRGLYLEINHERQHVADPVVASSLTEALTLGSYDVAILAVKSYDTESLLQTLSPYSAALPVFLCLQNGVDNETTLARVLGNDKVIAGTVTSAVGRLAAGDIQLERFRGVGIAGGHTLAPALLRSFNAAGLNARYYPGSDSLKWSKMLTNLMANASSAILNMAPVEIYADPVLYHLEITQMREALAIMDALKIKVTDLPGTPVRILSYLVRWLPPPISRPLLARELGKGRGAKMPSFYIDLANRRGKSEVGYLNGAVVRFGVKTGIPTPVNQVYTQTLMGLTCGELNRADFDHQPEKLIELVKQASQAGKIS